MQAQRSAFLKAQKDVNSCAVWGRVSNRMTGLRQEMGLKGG